VHDEIIVTGTKMIFTKAGKYKLLSIVIEKPISFKVSASFEGGLVVLRNDERRIKSLTNNDNNQVVVKIETGMLTVEFSAFKDNAILDFIYIL
jgi:hypothetical protein